MTLKRRLLNDVEKTSFDDVEKTSEKDVFPYIKFNQKKTSS